jgi:hypothetical protein|nr:MAG TPA: hypothetical protein [Caudoviricetes sp.]
MIFKRKPTDYIIHVIIYSNNEGIGPDAVYWSGYMTERDFFQICGRCQLKDTTGKDDNPYLLMRYASACREKDEVLVQAIEMAEQLGANDATHGVVPLLRMDELIMRDFIVYNKTIMREQAMKHLPPKRMTKEYRAYRLICSMGYCFNVDLNRFISNGESIFNQLVAKQWEQK